MGGSGAAAVVSNLWSAICATQSLLQAVGRLLWRQQFLFVYDDACRYTLDRARRGFKRGKLLVYDLDLLVDHLPGKPINGHVHPITLLPFHDEFFQISLSRLVATALRDHIEH